MGPKNSGIVLVPAGEFSADRHRLTFVGEGGGELKENASRLVQRIE